MEKLHFHLPGQQDFASELEAWVEANSYAVFGRTVYSRGQAYYEEGLVRLTNRQPGLVEGIATGSRRYTLRVSVYGKEVLGYCSCPYEAACKHLAAFLWIIDDLPTDQLNQIAQSVEPTGFRTYLQQLDRDTLIDLVDQFAPANYRDTIRLGRAGAAAVAQEFGALRRELGVFAQTAKNTHSGRAVTPYTKLFGAAFPFVEKFIVSSATNESYLKENLYYDLDEVAHRRYAVTQPQYLLVRPDNYVAVRCGVGKAAAIERYLGEWFG